MPATVKTSEWITAEEVPDPKPLPKLTGWKVLVRPLSIVQKTKGGLFIPDSVQDNVERITTVARVLAMGPPCYQHPDFMGTRFCEVGNIIAYPKFAGAKLKYKGVALLLLDEKDVTMVLQDARDIDPAYQLANYTA